MSEKKHIALIVDDEPDIRELLDITLSRMNIDTLSAENIFQAKKLLRAKLRSRRSWSIVQSTPRTGRFASNTRSPGAAAVNSMLQAVRGSE